MTLLFRWSSEESICSWKIMFGVDYSSPIHRYPPPTFEAIFTEIYARRSTLLSDGASSLLKYDKHHKTNNPFYIRFKARDTETSLHQSEFISKRVLQRAVDCKILPNRSSEVMFNGKKSGTKDSKEKKLQKQGTRQSQGQSRRRLGEGKMTRQGDGKMGNSHAWVFPPSPHPLQWQTA